MRSSTRGFVVAVTLAICCTTGQLAQAEPLLEVEGESLTDVVGAKAEDQYAAGTSGGAYLFLAAGTRTPSEGLASLARVPISVPTSGRYELEVVALALDGGTDSFFVYVDDHLIRTCGLTADKQWRPVQVSLFLPGGEHTLMLAAREPSRIDKMSLRPVPPRKVLHQTLLESPEPDGRRPLTVNPPTFRWPAFGAAPYTVELSTRPDLAEATKLAPVAETFCRPLQPLAPGTYHWHVTDQSGTALETVSFEVGEATRRWPLPPWNEALGRVPQGRPRLLMRPEDLPRFRQLAAGSCREMVAKWERWAEGVVDKELPAGPKPPGVTGGREEKVMLRVNAKGYANKLASPIETLCVLYLLTEKQEYADEVRRRALEAAALDPRGPVSHSVSDFANGVLALNLAWAYDTLYDQWSEVERAQLREAILGRCRIGFKSYKPSKEQALFAAHGWQHVIQDLTAGALALYHESPEAKAWFDWSFKMHVSLYPWYGGAEGGSVEGTSYYESTNMLTSLKAAALFEAATGVSFFDNPWYRNTPYFLLYTHGLGDAKSQFADSSGTRPVGPRERLATTLWAARLQDPYVAAYQQSIHTSTTGGVVDCLRLLWQPLTMPTPKPLAELPKARAFYDVGVVAMHSSLTQPADDLFFEFRSSPYGSYGHAHADQNSFNLLVGGQRLVADSGYYQSYGDAHHNGWTVQSKAHNTILFGGHGQGFRTTEAYGQLVDFEIGEGFVRTVGACPHAYPDVVVTRFDRHVLWLEPDVYLIADDLETAEPQTFQWLLHSADKMTLAGNTIKLAVGNAAGQLQFFQPAKLTFTQTDQFDPPVKKWRPDRQNRDYPNQWHLTAATTTPAKRQRFVSVLQAWSTNKGTGPHQVEVLPDERGVAIRVADGRTGRLDWRR